jgi:hypothetical protein
VDADVVTLVNVLVSPGILTVSDVEYVSAKSSPSGDPIVVVVEESRIGFSSIHNE